jgi:hypothetical protein
MRELKLITQRFVGAFLAELLIVGLLYFVGCYVMQAIIGIPIKDALRINYASVATDLAFLSDIVVFNGVILGVAVPLSYTMVARISEQYPSEILLKRFSEQITVTVLPVVLLSNILLAIFLRFAGDKSMPLMVWRPLIGLLIISLPATALLILGFIRTLSSHCEAIGDVLAAEISNKRSDIADDALQELKRVFAKTLPYWKTGPDKNKVLIAYLGQLQRLAFLADDNNVSEVMRLCCYCMSWLVRDLCIVEGNEDEIHLACNSVNEFFQFKSDIRVASPLASQRRFAS